MPVPNGRSPTYLWTDYLRYRAQSRGFTLAVIEYIVRFSAERYFDILTRRNIVIGRHGNRLVLIPYEEDEGTVTPITVHGTTRQQVNLNVLTGRFVP